MLRNANDNKPEVKKPEGEGEAKAKKDPLAQDAQLSAGLLLLRLRLVGAEI